MIPKPFQLPTIAIQCFALCVIVAGAAGCKKSSGASEHGDSSGAGPDKTSRNASTQKGHGPVIDGEHFTVRTVYDQQQGGMPVCIFVAPEKWRDESKVMWNYEHNSSPVQLAASVENPDNTEACYFFPQAEFFWLRPVSTIHRVGQNYGGLICAQPMPPAQTLLAYIQQLRGRFPGLKIVGSKDLPDLPAALKLPPAQNQRGVGIKISYEFNGKPVDEEFYAIGSSIDIPYDGPQGRTWQINWGLYYVHSFRAPAGTIDKRRPVFAAIAKSIRPNPAWQARKAAILAYMAEQFNQQLQAGYDQIAAAGRLSRQISANNDAMLASIDSRLQASPSSGNGGGSGGRSSNDKFDDYVRGVDTTEDPYYGTSQHSYNEQYHWTDGYGTYRNSNDASYNPNQNENGSWQLMRSTP